LLELRELLKKHGPKLAEGIEYGMLKFVPGTGEGIFLNAQKHSVNLYVGGKSKIDPKGVLLAGLDCGKSCIRFKKTTVIADTRIEEFIKKAIRTKS
jgi:uncharacterized protein YdhG (YjbR/CyaY superfamily)